MNIGTTTVANAKRFQAHWEEHYLQPEQLRELEAALLLLRDQTQAAVERRREELRQPMACVDELDQASWRADKEHLLSETLRGEGLLRELAKAMKRIEDGSYGYCEESGDPIGYDRLQACPFASLSLSAQEREERRRAIYRC
jgi:DnaK suppressor protein